MKMNRTEWIVVIICASTLAWLMLRPPAQKPADTSSTKPPPAATTPGTPEAPATPPTPAPPPPEAKIYTIKNEAAEYTFTNIGGGIEQVNVLPAKYSGKTLEVLNLKFKDDKGGDLSRHAIGALSSGADVLETLAYNMDAQTDRSITFSAKDPSTGLKITKKWELASPPEDKKDVDGYGYLWNLTVTFVNESETSRKDTFYVYTGLLGRLHDNDWIQPSATWYADGDAVEEDWTEFDHGGFLGIGKRPSDKELNHNLLEMVFAGVHNQYYSVLVKPEAVKKDGTTKTWVTRRTVSFQDGQRGKVSGAAIQSGVGMEPLSLDKGGSYTWKGQVFTGPRSGTVLREIGEDWHQSMHYGWFRSLSRLFIWLLNSFYGWVGIYAIAIMLLTLLVRTAIWPLHIKATRAMKRMSKLAPMMKDLREKYKEEPQRMQLEIMKLYREYNVNPLGGCLPLLFQFPIFLGYYNMMKSAVEMRGHSFLWVEDLSMPDTVYTIPIFGGIPINPLPILMTITMFLQMKVSPQPAMADNPQMQMQMKIFKIMPFLFMFFCYNFASALALYWTVQNIISIGQTWLMARQEDPPLVKGPPRKSFAERMMEAQKAREQQMRGGGKGPKPPRPGGGGGSAWKKD